MKILLSILGLLVLQNAAALVTETDDFGMPSSRFEYEYKVLGKLLKLSKEVEEIKNRNGVQEEFNNRLQIDLVSIKDRIKSAYGSIYIRWGRSECPGNDTELVYRGYGAGDYYSHQGGVANSLCLPEDPSYEEGGYSDTCRDGGYIYGMEYEMSGGFLSNLHNHNVPCAVCRSNRPSMLMIPGRNICYDSWTLEYAGYLVAGHGKHASSSEYICLDKAAEALDGGSADTEGRLLYIVEVRSGTLKSPPYVQCREMFCAVCTK